MNQSTHEVIRSSLPSLLAFLITLSILTLPGCRKEEKSAPQAPVVGVVEVIQKDVPIYSQWVGALEGNVNAIIRAEVTGYLIKQNYQNGDFVKKGQLPQAKLVIAGRSAPLRCTFKSPVKLRRRTLRLRRW